MSERWSKVKLGEVIHRSNETIETSAERQYREITVKLWGKGVVQRGVASGMGMSNGRRFVAHNGQFIISRIDARNGAVGIVPPELDGAVVTNDFPIFNLDSHRLEPAFLGWLSKTPAFVDLCKRASEGTTNRVRLQENRFLNQEVALPSLEEQRRIVARIGQYIEKIIEAKSHRKNAVHEQYQMLLSVFSRITKDAIHRPMNEIATLVRRPVEIKPDVEYPELGIRSFGNGTFHKPAISGLSLGTKRLFEIRSGDIVFSNVFAWEGAIAVADENDSGRFGSHRFITCVAKHGICTSRFLCFFFLTNNGLKKIGDASPGGAGRNRTLGLTALGKIHVPVPSYQEQVWFDGLQEKIQEIKKIQSESTAEMEAMIPSILDKAFSGGLK